MARVEDQQRDARGYAHTTDDERAYAQRALLIGVVVFRGNLSFLHRVVALSVAARGEAGIVNAVGAVASTARFEQKIRAQPEPDRAHASTNTATSSNASSSNNAAAIRASRRCLRASTSPRGLTPAS